MHLSEWHKHAAVGFVRELSFITPLKVRSSEIMSPDTIIAFKNLVVPQQPHNSCLAKALEVAKGVIL